MKQQNFHLSEKKSYEEIKKIYEEKILKQDFYDVQYATEWIEHDNPSRDMAKYIKETFNPKTVLDIGCGIGKLVHELRKLDIDAEGIEFSDAFIKISPVSEHIFQGDLLSIPSMIEKKYDLVICMEVLEHVPPTQLNQAIQNIKCLCNDRIILTIPSFGPNFNFYGLPLNESCWLRDARENVPFQNLVVDQDGIPHLGHISLATFKWWSEKFLLNGLIRIPTLEIMGYNNYNFLNYRWNLYVLQELSKDTVKIQNTNYYLQNLYETEDWGSDIGSIRWTKTEFEIYIKASKSYHCINLKFYSGPKELVYTRNIKIKIEILKEKDLKLFYEGFAEKNLVLEPDCWNNINIDGNYNEEDVFRLQCVIDKGFIPHYIMRNEDMRNLGIAIREIRLL